MVNGLDCSFCIEFFFFVQADYFAPAAETSPLLHTWSLAVEEQFYIFFPLVLAFVFKYFRRYLLALIVCLCFISLAASTLLLFYFQAASFYLLPFRAWELGTGAILAICVCNKSLPFDKGGLGLAILGLVLVVAAYSMLNKDSLFPGVGALLPCLGAVLIVAYGAAGWVGALLGNTIIVWFGKISYSLYLWHWPLIVFWKLNTGSDISPYEGLALFAISTFLGAFSTYFVERPFRGGARRWLARKVVIGGILTLFFCFVLGVLLTQNWLIVKPISPEIAKVIDVADYRNTAEYTKQFKRDKCFLSRGDGGVETIQASQCIITEGKSANVLVLGDSHAAQYWLAISEALPEFNVSQVTSSGCKPLMGGIGAPGCKQIMAWVFESLLPKGEIDVLVLSGRWSEDDLLPLHNTLKSVKARGVGIILFGPVPEYHGTLPFLLGRSLLSEVEFDAESYLDLDRFLLNRAINDTAITAGVPYIDVLGQLCADGGCRLFDSFGLPIQFDYGHFTLNAARSLISENKVLLEDAVQSHIRK